MKQILLFILLATSGYKVAAQVTAIPDAAFEEVLVTQGIDSDGVVNGQMSTADAIGITSLNISSPPSQWIYNVTGLSAFENLENLTLTSTMVHELDVSNMPNLKYLYCGNDALNHLDLSQNPLLEYLAIPSDGDGFPVNTFTEIDLSSNPNIRELIAVGGIERINLRNGNNNPEMHIDISVFPFWNPPEDYIDGNTCIEVDDESAAQNNQFPYSGWTIDHAYQSYSLVESCLVGTATFKTAAVSLYPNPASDIVYFRVPNGFKVDKVVVFDALGRPVREYETIPDAGISVADLSKGIYHVQIASGKNTQTQKLVVR